MKESILVKKTLLEKTFIHGYSLRTGKFISNETIFKKPQIYGEIGKKATAAKILEFDTRW